MPRNRRITYKRGFYHIFNRGHNKGKIFNDQSDYEVLLLRLTKLLEEGDWSIYSYCLMPNHYHFLIEEKNIPVAKFVSRLFTSYSIYFNKKYHRFGYLFQDRYKSKIIQKEKYFLTVSRYIHLNPFYSGLTDKPEEYRYSSLGEYTDNGKRKIIDFKKVSILIGESKKTLDQYLEFVRDGMNKDKDYDPFDDKKEIFGSPVFATHRKMRDFGL